MFKAEFPIWLSDLSVLFPISADDSSIFPTPRAKILGGNVWLHVLNLAPSLSANPVESPF